MNPPREDDPTIAFFLLLLCVQRMSCFFKELFLESQAFAVGLYSADGGNQVGDRHLGIELTQLLAGHRTIPGVVVWKTRVPPDPGVQAVCQLLPGLVRTRLI